MVNKNRIVPIQKVDFLTLVSLVMSFAEIDYNVLEAQEEGNFTLDRSGFYLANEPVKRINLNLEAQAQFTLYFVASEDFEGIYDHGLDLGDHIDYPDEFVKDGVTLYACEAGQSGLSVHPMMS